jgi:tRNA(Ile)-lysidine synthase
VRRAVQHLRWNLRNVNFQHVDAAVHVGREAAVGVQAGLPRGLALTVGYETLVVADADYVPPPDFPALSPEMPGPLPIRVPGETVLPEGGRVRADILCRDELPIDWQRNADPWRAFLDVEALGCRLYLRCRRAGDRFRPLGMNGKSKLVSEMLVNARVPAWWRDRVPLLVDEHGEILWVCGWRLDERAKVQDSTSRVAVISLCSDR